MQTEISAERSRWLTGLALLAAMGAAAVVAGLQNRTPSRLPGVDVTIVHGKRMPLTELRGHPVFVTFWSTTCAICLRERPQLADLYRELGPSGLEMVAVAMSYDPPSRVAATIERENIPFPVALDIDSSVETAFGGVLATPTSFLFAPDGTLVYRRQGAADIVQLRRDIQAMLATRESANHPARG